MEPAGRQKERWADLMETTPLQPEDSETLSPWLTEATQAERVTRILQKCVEGASVDEGRKRTVPPRRLDKSHGFMKFIVRNQKSRKDYEEEVTASKAQGEKATPVEVKSVVPKREADRKPQRIRPGFEVYQPPHARKGPS